MDPLAYTILTFVGLVCVGLLLRVLGVVRIEDARGLNAVIVYVGLPALVFQAVHRARIDASIADVLLVGWVVTIAMFIVAWAATKALRLQPRVAGTFILTAALGNTGYLGYPLALALLGERGLTQAVFYDVFVTVAALIIVGLAIARRYGGATGGRRAVFRELLAFPALGALAVSLALRPLEIPVPLSDGLDLLASMVAPLIMLSVGISLRPGAFGRWIGPLSVVGAVRLAVAPLFALAVSVVMVDAASSAETVRLIVLQAGMPAMMLSYVVSERFELDTEFAAAAIFVTTAASAVSVPVLQHVLS